MCCVSAGKTRDTESLMEIPLYVLSPFSLAAFKVLFLSLTSDNLVAVSDLGMISLDLSYVEIFKRHESRSAFSVIVTVDFSAAISLSSSEIL